MLAQGQAAELLTFIRAHLDGLAEGPLSALRGAAAKRFGELGFPTRKQEAWRFCDLERLISKDVLPVREAPAVQAGRLEPLHLGGESHRMVFVNGRYCAELSAIGELPAGVSLGALATGFAGAGEGLIDGSDVSGAQPFASLNAALFTDGFALDVEAGARLEKPLEVLYFSTAPGAGAVHVRNMIRLGARAEATVFETVAGDSAGFASAVTLAHIMEGGGLTHVKVEAQAADATHLSLVRANLGVGARYNAFVLATGAGLSRQDVHVTAAGRNAAVAVNGALLLSGDAEATLAPFVDHAAPDCRTSEVIKAVVADRAHGVFLGKMAVREGADGTDAHQLNQNLLIGAEARVDTKPELEIFADEVKCSHGATVGDLDEAALFYLQARGIPQRVAQAMLMEAFVLDVIEQAGLQEAVSDRLLRHVRRWLTGAGR